MHQDSRRHTIQATRKETEIILKQHKTTMFPTSTNYAVLTFHPRKKDPIKQQLQLLQYYGVYKTIETVSQMNKSTGQLHLATQGLNGCSVHWVMDLHSTGN